MYTRYCRLGLILACLVTTTGSALPDDSPATLDVCTALRRIESLDGKIVTVRGKFISGRELTELAADTACPGDLMIEGVKWAWAMEYSAQSSNDKLGNILKSGECRPPECRILVTVTGRLVSNRRQPIFTDRDGRTSHIGFGAFNVFPALINVFEVKEARADHSGGSSGR